MQETGTKRGELGMVPEEMKPALMGVVPSTLITSSKAGVPNITNISRVWYVDSSHVAIANHMLNKSVKNLKENPLAFIRTMDTATFSTWEIEVEYVGSRTDGEIFAEMKKQYEVLSIMLETAIPIKVNSAELFRVRSARVCEEENSHLLSPADLYTLLLEQLELKLGWDVSAVWIVEEPSNNLQLAALRGLDEESAAQLLKRVAQWSVQQEKPVRIFNIRSQYQYAITTFLHQEDDKKSFSHQDYRNVNHNYIAMPIIGEDEKVIAVICSQSNDSQGFSHFNEEILLVVSKFLSKLIERLPRLQDQIERIRATEQELERIHLEVSKRKGEVKTHLSPRELQVSLLIARGLSNDEIAKALFLSKRTITTHLERIYQKLEINSRAALASYVIENGLSDSSK